MLILFVLHPPSICRQLLPNQKNSKLSFCKSLRLTLRHCLDNNWLNTIDYVHIPHQSLARRPSRRHSFPCQRRANCRCTHHLNILRSSSKIRLVPDCLGPQYNGHQNQPLHQSFHHKYYSRIPNFACICRGLRPFVEFEDSNQNCLRSLSHTRWMRSFQNQKIHILRLVGTVQKLEENYRLLHNAPVSNLRGR